MTSNLKRLTETVQMRDHNVFLLRNKTKYFEIEPPCPSLPGAMDICNNTVHGSTGFYISF